MGLILGTFTGLSPGIHVNTLAEMGGSFGLLFAMGLTHTFLDAFPSTFLGVPDEGTVLSILPAHRLVHQGRGREVIVIALLSSILAVLSAFFFFPFYSLIAPHYVPAAGKVGAGLLLLLLLITERNGKLKALVIMTLSGLLGVAVLDWTSLKEPFYHLFTGLFGIPVLFVAINGTSSLPDQRMDTNIPIEGLLKFSFIGTILGMVSSLLPAFTASMGATIATLLSKDELSFLIAVYSINTANFLFGVFNYSLTGKTRNGIAVAMRNAGVEVPDLGVLFLSAILVGSLAVLIGSLIFEPYLQLVKRSNYRILNAVILAFLTVLSIYFDGIYGLWILGIASIVGYLAQLWGIRRTNCMAVLIIPLLLR